MALVTTLLVACEKLGAATFHVARAATPKAVNRNSPAPTSRPTWRRANAWMPCPVSDSASGADAPERMPLPRDRCLAGRMAHPGRFERQTFGGKVKAAVTMVIILFLVLL